MPLAKWKSHKVVEAAKIPAGTLFSASGRNVTFHLDRGEELTVSADVFARAAPPVSQDWYIVRYDGGTPKEYWSWSPADVFEAGYTLLQTVGLPVQDDRPEAKASHDKGLREYALGMAIEQQKALLGAGTLDATVITNMAEAFYKWLSAQ